MAGIRFRAMAESATYEEVSWGDIQLQDTLFTPLVKGGVLGGLALIVVARIAVFAILLNEIADFAAQVEGAQSLVTVYAFMLVDLIGGLLLAGTFVIAALINTTMKDWIRVVLVTVAALILIGSNVLSAFQLNQILA